LNKKTWECQICPLPDASDLLRAYPKSFHPGSSSERYDFAEAAHNSEQFDLLA